MSNWQKQAAQFAQKHNLIRPSSVYALDLMSELGEIAKEILLATNYGTRPAQYRPELAAELGDALYSLCLLAETTGVDLEQALRDTLQKYEQRWQNRGHPGNTEKS